MYMLIIAISVDHLVCPRYSWGLDNICNLFWYQSPPQTRSYCTRTIYIDSSVAIELRQGFGLRYFLAF